MKKHFEGVIIGNVGYTRDVAEGAIRSGAADLVSNWPILVMYRTVIHM